MASVFLAYLFWFIGGLFGLHHIYLGRTAHAVFSITSFGGYLIGWQRDFFKLPQYVRQYNCDPVYVNDVKTRMKRRPGFSAARSVAMYLYGYAMAGLGLAQVGPFEPTEIMTSTSLVPQFPLWWLALSGVASSVGIVFGIFLIGNIDSQYTANYRYVTLACLVGVFFDQLVSYVRNVSTIYMLRILVPIVVYQRVREWKPTSVDVTTIVNERSWLRSIRRVILVFASAGLILVLQTTYLYFYYTVDMGKLAVGDLYGLFEDESHGVKFVKSLVDNVYDLDIEGDESGISSNNNNHQMPSPQQPTSTTKNDNNTTSPPPILEDWSYFLNEAPIQGKMKVKQVVHNFMQSPAYRELAEELKQWASKVQQTGSFSIPFFSVDVGNVDWVGAHAAAKELGVSQDADMVTLNKAKKKLQREFHPDRHDAPAAKQHAQNRFQAVTAAFETLKQRRELMDQQHAKIKSEL